MFKPELALVGEAWGAEEALAGAPFVGPAGRCLNQLLRTAGIERERCWVGNVLNLRPPGDDLSALCAGAKERKAWGAAYPLAHLPPLARGKWLRPEYAGDVLSLPERIPASARVIVALGATAAWALLGATGIAEWRGTLSPLGERWVLPTYHPAAVLRLWKLFHTVAHDLARARAWSESVQPPTLLSPTIYTAAKAAEISAAHEGLIASGWLCALDIETSRGQIDTVALGTAECVLVVPFVDVAQPSRSWFGNDADEHAAIRALKELCEDRAVPKVLQNGTYDAYWLWRQWGIAVRSYAHDTRLMHHALYPELPKSLGYLAATYVPIAPWKHTRGWGRAEETGKE